MGGIRRRPTLTRRLNFALDEAGDDSSKIESVHGHLGRVLRGVAGPVKVPLKVFYARDLNQNTLSPSNNASYTPGDVELGERHASYLLDNFTQSEGGVWLNPSDGWNYFVGMNAGVIKKAEWRYLMSLKPEMKDLRRAKRSSF